MMHHTKTGGPDDALRARVCQQAAVAELGQAALDGADLAALMDRAVFLVADGLEVEFAKVLELAPDGQSLLLKAGIGWQPGLVGRATVGAGPDTHAGYTLRHREAVIVNDLAREQRFTGAALLRDHRVVSGLSVIIGGGEPPYGVLGAHTAQWRSFGQDDLHFLQGVANVLASAVQRRRNDDALRDSHRRLEAALAEVHQTQQQMVAQERLHAMGQLASGMAHDFNNSLAPILGYSELLLAHPEQLKDPERVREFVELIRIGARDATNVVRRLREFYRGRVEPDLLEPVDLNEILHQTIALTQPRWQDQALASGVAIQLVTEPGQVPPILGDASSLRDVLANLVLNAVDALPRGGTITFRTRQEDSQVVVEVEDTGIGMTEEVRRRCLEPFFTTKGEQGSGLGLALARNVLSRYHGTIEIESAPGKGTKVALRLPAQAVAARAVAAAGSAATEAVRPLSILLVEDDAPVRSVLADILTADGHRVEVATDGADGLARFRAGCFDLVITARAMPGLSGDQVAAAVKEAVPGQKVIMLTGFGDLMNAAGELPAVVDLVVGKPIAPAGLRAALAQVAAGRGGV